MINMWELMNLNGQKRPRKLFGISRKFVTY